MSFGFSVGDILAGAGLAYRIYEALSETKGASKAYQRLSTDLLGVHKVLLQVGELQASNQLAQSTLNALLFLTTGINEAMESFMLELERYRESLATKGGSGSLLKDTFYKGKWTIRMPDEANKLHTTLQTNLISLSILVQLACYFNTGYDSGLSATLQPCAPHGHATGFSDINTNALISAEMARTRSPDFKTASLPAEFFRPGQVLSVRITTRLDKDSESSTQRVLWLDLPLGSASDFRERQHLRDRRRQERLEQILQLPLAEMFKYATLEADGQQVGCNICRDQRHEDRKYGKEEWVAEHFRMCHFQTYQALATTTTAGDHNSHNGTTERITLSLDDIKKAEPILSDKEIVQSLDPDGDPPSNAYSPWTGAIMIRRFVVVRQGTRSSLCLGIHTYAGTGCSYQPDQSLFGILHSSKEIPPPVDKETGMRLMKPVRLKADHPSTTLPSTARIHYGRVYEVKHDVQLKSIGLIHDSSMETLLEQFNGSYTCRGVQTGDKVPAGGDQVPETVTDSTVSPADVELVCSIRKDVNRILGKDGLLGKRAPNFSVERFSGISA
ncbi:hypothetical protein BJX68DRAFT_273307 [Aspergillus pseudodeflectus]|uniref:DUF6590 domain-containing protein n=1 Tax=Aspergillus pseudodeflectus TaxID=176178 RepID=A0ABR4JAN0_9EURO